MSPASGGTGVCSVPQLSLSHLQAIEAFLINFETYQYFRSCVSPHHFAGIPIRSADTILEIFSRFFEFFLNPACLQNRHLKVCIRHHYSAVVWPKCLLMVLCF